MPGYTTRHTLHRRFRTPHRQHAIYPLQHGGILIEAALVEYKVGSYLLFLHLRFLHTWAHKGWWWCCLLLVTRKRSEARPLSALSRERAWKKKYSEGLKRDVFCNARRGILNKPPRSIFPNISGLTRTYLARLCSGWVSVSMGSFIELRAILTRFLHHDRVKTHDSPTNLPCGLWKYSL